MMWLDVVHGGPTTGWMAYVQNVVSCYVLHLSTEVHIMTVRDLIGKLMSLNHDDQVLYYETNPETGEYVLNEFRVVSDNGWDGLTTLEFTENVGS